MKPLFLRILARYTRLAKASVSDAIRYARRSNLLDFSPPVERHAGEALRLVHSLEKGLVLPEGRRPFGIEKMQRLAELRKPLSQSPPHQWIASYIDEVCERVREENKNPGQGMRPAAGSVEITKQVILSTLPEDPEAFFSSRRSIRTFQGPPLTARELENIVKLAQTAPSVCNRQGGRVRFFADDPLKSQILALQNGNKGFGHLIPTVAVISADLAIFHGVGERNQGWVDGGLFAMTLALAAHSLGFGTCFLNWSAEVEQDMSLRRLLKIPENEIIITLLALGHLPESIHVAESRKRPLTEVWLNSGNCC